MPNHIKSQVEISGDKKSIAQLISKTGLYRDTDMDDNKFDFNGIIKMPEELLNTVSPTDIVPTQAEADIKNAEYNKSPHITDGAKERYISVDEEARRIKEYRAINWYDWSTLRWGTKWNSYDVKFICGDDTKIVIEIQTAWNTPNGIWEELERQGFTVRGVMYGEMDGYDWIGDGQEVFEAWQEVEVDYCGKLDSEV